MGGVGDPQPRRTFPKPRHPGYSRAPSDSPGEGEGPREQKPRHSALASPGARWSVRHRASRLTPFPALRVSPGGGWGAAEGRAGRVSEPLIFSSFPPSPPRLAHSFLGCKVLGGKIRGECGVRLERAGAGGGAARVLPSCASKEAFVGSRRGHFPGSAGHCDLVPPGGRGLLGRVLGVIFFF